MSKTTTKATIDANIKQNGTQAITGQILNSVLTTMVDDYGAQEEVASLDSKVTDLESRFVTESTKEINLNDNSLWTNGGLHKNYNSIGSAINVTQGASGYCHAIIDVAEGEIYDVRTYVTTSANYVNYVAFVDSNDIIKGLFAVSDFSARVNDYTSIVVPVGATKMYLFYGTKFGSVVKTTAKVIKRTKENIDIKTMFSPILKNFKAQVNDAVSAINAREEEGHNCFVFAFITDTHGNRYSVADAMDILNYFQRLKAGVPVYHGGDIIFSTDFPSMEGLLVSELVSEVAKFYPIKNMYFLKGNHEAKKFVTSQGETAILEEQFFQIAQSNLKPLGNATYGVDANGNHIGCFYVDYPSQKIRVIASNSFESFDESGAYIGQNLTYTKAQVDWIYETLRGVATKADDWGVIFLTHDSGSGITSTNSIKSEVKLLDLFVTKSSWTSGDGTKTYTFADTTNGHLVALIHGHDHTDTIGDQHGISANINYNSKIIGVAQAGANGAGNFAVDIMCCDTTSRQLIEYRIGTILRNGVAENVLVNY